MKQARRTASPDEGGERGDLARLRAEIERLDSELVQLIARRVRLARDVGEAKRQAGMPTLDPTREATVVRRAVTLARDAGLEPDEEIRQIYWLLIALCRRAQTSDAL
jgi:chorismate mutase/prephenate dehydratase